MDLIIFSEVMFDENISGEFPEHIDFIRNKAIPLFQSWGYETKILHSDRTYMDCFYRKPSRGKFKNSEKRCGFPMMMKCVINRDCKMRQIRKFWKEIKDDFTQYIGIAIDEPIRMERMAKTESNISLLEKYGYTEQMAFDLYKKYDLLSPIYDFAPRGGVLVLPKCKIRRTKTSQNKP